MIQATVTGNLGRDPELKDTRTGKKMATFSVASTTKRDGKDPETTWLDIVCFDRLAEDAAGNFRKGMKVIVIGQLSMETFARKDGTDGSALRMVANDIGLMIRSKQDREEADDDQPVRMSQPQQTQQRQPARSRNEPWG
jgi:single-strand DNA-binding protein